MTALDGEGAASEQEVPRKKLSGKKIVLFFVLPVLLLVAGAAGVWFFVLNKKGAEHAEEEAPKVESEYKGPPVFKNLDSILVNLNSGERRPSVLKLTLTLELSKPEDDKPIVDKAPYITDAFQVFLRELKPSELQGSAGSNRLREELLMRVNMVVAPVKVKDVLIREIIVQ